MGLLLSNVVKGSSVKFVQSVDLVINTLLKKEESIRGIITLPYSLKKENKISVIAVTTGDNTIAIKEEGADFVIESESDILTMLSDKKFLRKYNWCIATPDMLQKLGKVARYLAAKNLMPSVKAGTVGSDLVSLLRSIKLNNLVPFRSDKNGSIHLRIGDLSQTEDEIMQNANVAMQYVKSLLIGVKKKSKSVTTIVSAYLSTTMSKGSVVMNLSDLD